MKTTKRFPNVIMIIIIIMKLVVLQVMTKKMRTYLGKKFKTNLKQSHETFLYIIVVGPIKYNKLSTTNTPLILLSGLRKKKKKGKFKFLNLSCYYCHVSCR